MASWTFGLTPEQHRLTAVDDELSLAELDDVGAGELSAGASSAIAGVKPRLMNPLPCTRKSARTLSSMICVNDCLADAPMIATRVTSASPIISAEAVVAVRRGFRIAFSRASTPDVPRSRAGTQPRNRDTGRATSGLSIATPMNTRNAATPTTPAAPPGTSSELTLPNRPSASQDDPDDGQQRRRPGSADAPLVAMTAVSRIAAIGRHRAARRAGDNAETNVTTVPATSATITVRARMTGACVGSSNPKAASSAWSPIATSTPSASPSTDDSRPTTNASAATDRVTCLPDAPSARSSASSRDRWATMIENVL